MKFLWLMILSSILLLLSGCSTIIGKIQQVTGNEVENVSEKTPDSRDNANEEKLIYEQGFPPPAPSTILRDILNDEGKGSYAGNPYQIQKVNQALNVMPQGLSEDKVYAYLLGLIGKNYKYDLDNLSSMLGPNYQTKMRSLAHGEDAVSSVPITTKGKTPVASPPKPSNVVILIDVSSTMAIAYQGKTRYDWAKLFTVDFIRQLPKGTNVTIRLFGHKGGPSKKDKDASCRQTQEIYRAGPTSNSKLMGNFSKVGPTGWSPLVEALRASMEELKKHQLPRVENKIYVVADSSDTCGADLSQQITDIRSSKLGVMVNVVGINVPAKDENELTQLAEATGGEFQPIGSLVGLNKVAKGHANEIKQINEPWQLRTIQKMVKGYQVANEVLDSKYQEIETNLQEEHQRLTNANQLVKQQQKIDSTESEKIHAWTNNRYKEVLGFTEQKWHAKEAELDQSFNTAIKQIDQKWQQNKVALKPYENRKKSLVDQVKRVLPNKVNNNSEE
jgi:Ca-activated chloride channel family protein